MSDTDKKLHKLVERVSQRIESGKLGDVENMTIKELRLKALDEADRLTASDEQASVISVVVYVVVT